MKDPTVLEMVNSQLNVLAAHNKNELWRNTLLTRVYCSPLQAQAFSEAWATDSALNIKNVKANNDSFNFALSKEQNPNCTRFMKLVQLGRPAAEINDSHTCTITGYKYTNNMGAVAVSDNM
jgi:hypothetical protein